MPYQTVIGLEVHLQLKTKSKIFSACPQEYHGEGPNTFTDPFTLGLPGTLPILNRAAVELAMMFGLDGAVSSEITRKTMGWDPTGATLLEDIEAGAYDA